jgi:hypothetical protein
MLNIEVKKFNRVGLVACGNQFVALVDVLQLLVVEPEWFYLIGPTGG